MSRKFLLTGGGGLLGQYLNIEAAKENDILFPAGPQARFFFLLWTHPFRGKYKFCLEKFKGTILNQIKGGRLMHH